MERRTKPLGDFSERFNLELVSVNETDRVLRRPRNKSWGLVVALVAAACGSSSEATTDGSVVEDAGQSADAEPLADARMQDPSDPVEEVLAHIGGYTFGKLTTEDYTAGNSGGTWFNDNATEHRVTTTRVHYARYRDNMLLQSKTDSAILIYDQATTTVGDPITLPSDAVGRATIRGGLVYIGGLAKLYSYEIATEMWRSQDLEGAGTCHHVAAGKTRLFAVCTSPTESKVDMVFSTWANKTMSDVVPSGIVSPGRGAETSWIAIAPNEDVAYFGSITPDLGCVGSATIASIDSCATSVSENFSTTSAQVSEDGATLYVTTGTSDPEDYLREVTLTTKQVQGIRRVNSYATCPDNSVVFQDGVISQRRAGGVTTDVRLGFGGEADIGCPLKLL